MSNPTSNFNWQMPTNSDLVTDLPADFEVFGQAVDSTMADLKGGTTGQILSKTTNADMDFTWINNDQGDITAVNVTSPITGGGTSGAVTVGIQSASTSQSGAVQLSDSTSTTSSVLAATPTAVKSAYDLASAAVPKSTFTAKGSIAAASAASTPANLTVGTDYAFLEALSTESTGLKWRHGLTSYTPSVSCSSGSITSYTSNAYYLRLGKMCFVSFNIKITNNGTGAGTVNFDLPTYNGANVRATGTTQETDVTGNNGIVYAAQNAISGVIVTQAGGYPGGTNYRLQGNLWFEVA